MTDDVDDIARQRTESMQAHYAPGTFTPFVDDFQRKGLAGERALARFFDVPNIPRADLHGGDGGNDLLVRLKVKDGVGTFRVDVKCAAKPKELWVRKGAVKADIYVLAGYAGCMDEAFCLGWQWAALVALAPVRDCQGRVNHCFPRERLRDMDELLKRFAGTDG